MITIKKALTGLFLVGGYLLMPAFASAKETPARPEADAVVTWSRFISRVELLEMAYGAKWDQPQDAGAAAGNKALRDQLEIVWPNIKSNARESGFDGLLIDAAVFIGKKAVGFIGKQIEKEMEKHGGAFSATAYSGVIVPSSDRFEFAAIELRRDRLKADKSVENIFQGIILIRPYITDVKRISVKDEPPQIDSTQESTHIYQLLPVYFVEKEHASKKLWGDSLTATMKVELSVYYAETMPDKSLLPTSKQSITAEWLFEEYKVSPHNVVNFSESEVREINLKDQPGYGQVYSRITKIKGPAPSTYFSIPRETKALFAAKVSVSEVDASRAVKYLKKFAGWVKDSEDDVGTLIKDELSGD